MCRFGLNGNEKEVCYESWFQTEDSLKEEDLFARRTKRGNIIAKWQGQTNYICQQCFKRWDNARSLGAH